MNASVPPETCVSEWEEGTEGGAEGGREGGMVGRTKSLVMSWLFARAQVSEYQRSQAQHRVFVRARISHRTSPPLTHTHTQEVTSFHLTLARSCGGMIVPHGISLSHT
jgi:hypothetical protein